MIRRLGAFLGNGLFQIGAGIEGGFDHAREGMQAFEAVRTFGIAKFGLAQRSRMAKIFELIFPQEVTLLPSPALWLVFRSPLTHTQRQGGRHNLRGR
jgi:hypothetical protein